MGGALSGLNVVEFAGIGPAPFCATMLGDHGARVIRIGRPGVAVDPRDGLGRNRINLELDLKNPIHRAKARELCAGADVVIEGYRPGVMERLELGPEVLLEDNPRLVYGRMTGWGQTGPYAQAAGHDINYIALSGVLHTIGREGERPVPPANYVGDFGGGGMMLAFGILAALLSVRCGKPGQVVDAAMTDGSAMLSAMSCYLLEAGIDQDRTGANMLGGAAHYYDTYECADGKFISIGAIEPQFYDLLLETIGHADDPDLMSQGGRETWPTKKARLSSIFKSRTCAQWCSLMEATDICFAPVLSLREAASHPHNQARGTFIQIGGVTQPAPAPRFSATPAPAPQLATTQDALAFTWGKRETPA